MAAGMTNSADLTSTVLGDLPSPGHDQTESAPSFVAPDLQGDEAQRKAEQVYRDLAKSAATKEKWAEPSKKAFRYFDLDQWDELDRMAMEQAQRPCLVFDRVQPIVNAVAGMEKLNRKIALIKPTPTEGMDDLETAGELATESIEQDLELTHGHEERSLAALDTLICGMGWYAVYPDYERHSEAGIIILEHFSPFDAWWDPKARMINMADSTWRARRTDFSAKAFAERWPDMVDRAESARIWYSEQNMGRYELVTPWYSRANEEANPQVGELIGKSTEIPVFQYQHKIKARYWRYFDPRTPDQLKEVDDDEWQFLVKRIREMGGEPPEAVPILKPRVEQLMVGRGLLLEPPLLLKCGDFTLRCITGKWHNTKKYWYGMVRGMMDAQSTRNKSISSALAFHLTNARGGVMYEAEAFEDSEEARLKWSKYDAWIELQAGGAQKIIQRQNTTLPPELGQFFQISTQAITEGSGVTDEAIGMATQETGAQTNNQRIARALSGLGWFWDSTLINRADEARVMLELIREYWTNGQLVQIGGPLEIQAIPLLQQLLPLAYTVSMDDSVRHSPDMKAQIWEDIKPFLPAFLRFGFGPFLMKILKIGPFPPILIRELEKQAMQTPIPGPGQQQKGRGQQQRPREDPQLTQAKTMKLSAEAKRALAQAKALEDNHGTELARLIMEGQAEQAEQQHRHRLEQHHAVNDTMKMLKPPRQNPQPNRER